MEIMKIQFTLIRNDQVVAMRTYPLPEQFTMLTLNVKVVRFIEELETSLKRYDQLRSEILS